MAVSLLIIKKYVVAISNFPTLNQQVWKCKFPRKKGQETIYTTRFFIVKPHIKPKIPDLEKIHDMFRNNDWEEVNIEGVRSK